MTQQPLQPMAPVTKIPKMPKSSLVSTLLARKSIRLCDLEKKKTFSFLVYHHAHKTITFGRSISGPLRVAKVLFDTVLEPMSSGTKVFLASAEYETITARFDTASTAIVAALTYKPHSKYVEIVLMATEAKHRNKGAARSLLHEVVSIGKKRNAIAVIASVSKPAIEAYLHMGFSQIAN